MKEVNVNSGGGSIFLSLLTVLFIGLKLTGYIDWSWWYVMAPMWIPVVVLVSLGTLAGLGYGVYKLFTRKRR